MAAAAVSATEPGWNAPNVPWRDVVPLDPAVSAFSFIWTNLYFRPGSPKLATVQEI